MGWINVNERLPEDNAEVLVTVAEGTELKYGTVFGKATVNPGIFCKDDMWYPRFVLDDGTEVTKEVLAWMPMPEPYNE